MTPIAGYNGKYFIDKNCNIFSIPKNRILKPTISLKGYLIVTLNEKTRYVHQLLFETFIDSDYKKKGLIIDHKDRNPLNNTLENLRLANKSQNSINSDREFRLCIFKRKNGKYRVIYRRSNIIIRKQFDTYQEALAYRLSL